MSRGPAGDRDGAKADADVRLQAWAGVDNRGIKPGLLHLDAPFERDPEVGKGSAELGGTNHQRGGVIVLTSHGCASERGVYSEKLLVAAKHSDSGSPVVCQAAS